MHGGLGTFLFGSHLWHVIAANKKICSPLQDFETEYLYLLNPKTVPADQVNLPKNFREYVKDESYPEFCADQHLYYPFH